MFGVLERSELLPQVYGSTKVNKTECEVMEVQKSDRFIVALKTAKAGGAKGATSEQFEETKHERL